MEMGPVMVWLVLSTSTVVPDWCGPLCVQCLVPSIACLALLFVSFCLQTVVTLSISSLAHGEGDVPTRTQVARGSRKRIF